MKRRVRSSSLSRTMPVAAVLGARPAALVCVLLSVAALVYSAVSPQGAYGLRVGVSDIVSPVVSTVSRPVQEAALFVRNVSGLAALQAENLRLYQENIRLREWYQAAQLYQSENAQLRTLLNLKPAEQHNFVTARILADTGSSFARSLLVEIGQGENAQKGQAVISGSGLIGRVIEVGEQVSRVLLLSDINSRIPVMVEGTTTHGILAGQNDDQPLLTHLPSDFAPAEGMRIVTSGIGGVYPVNIPVGLLQNTADGWRILPYADVQKLLYVRIIEKPAHNVLRGIDADS